MDIQAAEISAILKEEIKNFGEQTEVAEVGQVLSVGDGIAEHCLLAAVRFWKKVSCLGRFAPKDR